MSVENQAAELHLLQGALSKDLEQCLALSVELLCTIDFEGHLTRLNDRWRDVLGYTLEELQRTPLSAIVHSEDAGALTEQLAAVRSGGGDAISQFGSRLRRKRGGYCCIRWRWRVAPGAREIIATALDITESRSALSQSRNMIDAAPTGMMMVDEKGHITLVNAVLTTLFGYEREEMLGQPMEILVPGRFRAGHPKLRRSFTANPNARLMGQGRSLFGARKDGSEFPLEIGLSPIASGGHTFTLCSVIDVTERNRHETELKERIQELQRRRSELNLLSEMSSLLQHAISVEEVFAIVDLFGESLFQEFSGSVYLLPPSRDSIELMSSWGTLQSVERFGLSDCWAMRRSQPHHSTGVHLPSCSHITDTTGANLCIPMTAHGISMGIINLQAPATASANQIQSLEALGKAAADQLALALSNLQLREKLRRLSIRDPLTGLFNRRYLEETIDRELPRAARRERPLSVLMLDVDHFKKFNDTHGHHAADDVLRILGSTLMAAVRDDDIVCRFGGEEIVLILPECDLASAVERADRLRELVYRATGGKITVSIGVSEYPGDGTTWEQLLQTADKALYKAKKGGRNIVVSSGSLRLDSLRASPDEASES